MFTFFYYSMSDTCAIILYNNILVKYIQGSISDYQSVYKFKREQILPYNAMTTTAMESLHGYKQLSSIYRDYADSSTFSPFHQKLATEVGGQYRTLFNKWVEKAINTWVLIIKKTHARQCLSEFFGTFLLVVSLLWSILIFIYY